MPNIPEECLDYHIIINPVSGVGSAPKFVEDHVVPLLDAVNSRYHVHTTSSTGDAGRIGRMIKLEHSPPFRVIIAGGDGTAHEMMEGIIGDGEVGKWDLAVLPLGTANALHSTLFPPGSPPVAVPPQLEAYVPESAEDRQKLASLILALSDAKPRKLPIVLTQLQPNAKDASSEQPPAPIPSHIVLSTSLHAALLDDSEALRAAIPGLERFKAAAAQNITVFFPARVELIPANGGVQQLDPATGAWVAAYSGVGAPEGKHVLEGPFAYFLSTVTTDRLEPRFVIVPTVADPGEGTMDIVVMRPHRDPLVQAALAAGGDGTDVWPARISEVLTAAYDEGKHVRLVYDESGKIVPASKPGDTNVTVETFRCKGFKWAPTDSTHAKSHLVCADGSIYTIPEGGSAEGTVMDHSSDEHGFWVWGA